MPQQILKAPRLQRGDTIGIVSPSWGGAGAFPHRVEQGVGQLNALGFQVKFGKHALNQHGFVSDTPEHRASDLHEMFRDPEVRLILAAIGGDHSCHLLPLLDFELVRRNPKLFMGYSDVTVLNVALRQQTGLVTFNGPALLTDFGEYPAMPEYTKNHFLQMVCNAEPAGRIEPAPEWTEEMLQWSTREDRTRARTLQRAEGWHWLKGDVGEGILMGGCLESLQHLRGTPYWGDWEDTILFLETSEDKPLPSVVDGILMDYENMGVFQELRGLLVGRPMGYMDEEKAQLEEILLERTKRFDLPIVCNMDFGHTSPQMTLPLGCRARIDVANQQFEILEAGVV